MAGRPKGTGRKPKTLVNKFTEVYLFEVGNRVYYIGGLWSEYKMCIGTITKRSNKKNRIDYSVLFDDGVEKTCIKQSVLKDVYEQIKLENVMTTEEANNENH